MRVVSLRIKGSLEERIENSRGELKFGKAIRKILEHSAQGGEEYLKNIMGTEEYYEKVQAQE